MTIKKIADEVEAAVKLADALGKSEDDVRAAVGEVVAGLPAADVKAVHAHVAQSVADDSR